MSKLQSLLEDFGNAIKNLAEILVMEKNNVVRDAAIKRFEIVFELAWKTTKAFLEEHHNATCVSARTCFKEAFSKDLIKYDDFWVDVISTRNYTAHTYREKLAERVYNELPRVLKHFQELIGEIIKQIKE